MFVTAVRSAMLAFVVLAAAGSEPASAVSSSEAWKTCKKKHGSYLLRVERQSDGNYKCIAWDGKKVTLDTDPVMVRDLCRRLFGPQYVARRIAGKWRCYGP